MCGIVGIVHLDGAPSSEATDGPFLREAARRLAHRGPDDEQFLYWGPVGIGFRRLAIVDLATGRQPLDNDDGSVVQVTNGEIYNHAELRRRLLGGRDLGSLSDCAVIPYLYEELGLGYLSELNGMFATAVLDRRHRKLVLARDRLGIKPLYYYADSELLVFASEIKALLACARIPRRFDWRSALTYVREEFEPRPSRPLVSFFDGIEHLPGGGALEVELDSGRVREHRYWDLLVEPDETPRSAGDYVEEYRALLEDSVRMRLMADVEYGLFLSGGIDSVAIARLASSRASGFHTFSVLSQSTLANGDSESAHRAARAFGIENHQVLFDWRELPVSASDWRRILWATETFEAGAEQYYKYLLHGFARSLRPGLKVMLLGQGSDELNGGYSTRWAEWRDMEQAGWEHFEDAWRSAELESLRRGSGLVTCYDGLRTVGESLGAELSLAESVVSREFLAESGGRRAYPHPWHAYRDAYRYNLQMFNLWHEDRTAAAHSTENRVPFLDHRIVELTLRVPPSLYRELFWDKSILRRAMAPHLPEDLCRRKKVPFFMGEDERYSRRLMYQLLRSEDDRLIHEGLEGSRRAGGIVDEKRFWRLVEDQPNDPEYRNVDALLQLVNMGLLQQMAEEAPGIETPLPPRLSEASIDDWDAFRRELGDSLVARRESLSLESVPRFAEGVLLTRCEGGDPDWVDEGGYYVIVKGELRFVIDAEEEAWIELLRHVDSKKSVETILAERGLARDRVWKHLEEAVELGVIEI